jgi:glycosyltransferase involved in cell wall biosynthesis
MSKVILISNIPLPFPNIGSWSTLYHNYLSKQHDVDYIICPKPNSEYVGIEYGFAENNSIDKLRKKLFGKDYNEYLMPLKKMIRPGEKYIIQVIDNPGIVRSLGEFLNSQGWRDQCYVQFFHHGFGPFFSNHASKRFFMHVDEMVVLTKASYHFFKEYYGTMTSRFSVLSNGIDTQKFYAVSTEKKQQLKHTFNASGKTVFLWCSQDRPKKGLSLILDVWKKIYAQQRDIELWIVGADRKIHIDGVRFFGRIPNNELPGIYQASDVFLFPTLCYEGFGMALIEALHCGNFCIASAFGGVPEVLEFGALGMLVQNPNFVSDWEMAINQYLASERIAPQISREVYSTSQWNSGMNAIIDKAKRSIEGRQYLRNAANQI